MAKPQKLLKSDRNNGGPERVVTPVMKTWRRATWYVGANVEQGTRVWRRRS
ncbi:hypothetical protein ES288_A01G223700v1 [Gossypium darwinii]|uniref:Uncharacterized protein n=1 Tax=Gossypium darwinii TaxID=34276 RepID=A0A5D2HQ72_GOSDA|nr:hypothetical protein ES288_A01G223700v1 [Gossypium darwinii]